MRGLFFEDGKFWNKLVVFVILNVVFVIYIEIFYFDIII